MRTFKNTDAVLVSGASSGIGLAIVEQLQAKGATVLAGVRSQADADRLQALSPSIHPVMLDIIRPESIADAKNTVENFLRQNGGRLRAVVNNAGLVVGGPLEFLSTEAIRDQFEVNVFGHLALTQAFIPLLRESKGRVVNISSIAGLLAFPFMGPYCASKFALEAFSDALRMELAPWEVHVILIEPGSIATPLWQKALSLADQQRRSFSDDVHRLYGDAMPRVEAAARDAEKRGTLPRYVADAVLRAIGDARPRTRYMVGLDAKGRRLLRWLPDRVRDKLIRRQIGLPSQAEAETAEKITTG